MALTIPSLTRPLPLAEYADGLELRFGDGPPRAIHVWVNPPRAMLDERTQLSARAKELHQALGQADATQEQVSRLAMELIALGDQMNAWYARLWSQHPDPATHWTAAEVSELAGLETDPALYGWLLSQSQALIDEHRARNRKN